MTTQAEAPALPEGADDESTICAHCERPLAPTEALAEARRLLVGYPLGPPEHYFETRNENLLASIAGSLLVIATTLSGETPVAEARPDPLCACGHPKSDHSSAREDDFGCNVAGCYRSGRCNGWPA